MKEWLCTIAGIVGGFIATLFGGWDSALATLVSLWVLILQQVWSLQSWENPNIAKAVR